ncbi:DUF58 domain-containing protein [Acidiplasma aeolicum]|uniref:DUF58 domain-containing protein n=1 Tax=Acidiplasma aeolicum TaxID=507754 RepID=A0A0Q0XFU8_9ARCH|nr:DUF58 domain-containing protein [Acidiplasma aeolicum]KQB33453.1 hypothetical protein AOG54_07010 [Acidiplasma aeolicum]
MIKKLGYVIITAILSGLLESIIIGYSGYIIFTLILFFIVSSDIIFFNYSSARYLSNIDIRREVNTQIFRKNKTFEINIVFKNNNNNDVSFYFFDEALDILNISENHSGIIKIRKKSTVTKKYEITPRYIGKYSLGDITIIMRDIFDLAYSERKYCNTMEIKIYPSANDIRSQRTEMLSSFIYTYGIHYSKKAGQGYDLYGIRPYTENDDFRYIAWTRYDESNDILMVKEMEEEREITVIFLLDYSNSMNFGGDDKIYDKTVTNIINAAYYMVKNRDNVGFFIYSSEHNYFIKPDKSGNSIKDFETKIASILPGGDFDFESAIKILNKRTGKKPLIFVMTASDINIKKPEYAFNVIIFIIDHTSFYNYNPSEPLQDLLMRGLYSSQISRLRLVRSSIIRMGYRADVVQDKTMLPKIMEEYNYARSINLGAV